MGIASAKYSSGNLCNFSAWSTIPKLGYINQIDEKLTLGNDEGVPLRQWADIKE